MNRGLSVALLAVGVVLMVLGLKASEAFDSEVSRLFTGAPADKTIWLLIGGVGAAVLGLFGLLRRER